MDKEFELLKNVDNTIKADLIISILMAYDIPSYKKYQSSGEYLNIVAGYNYQGIDIYVIKSLIDEAKEILKEIEGEEGQENDINTVIQGTQEFKDLEEKYNNNKRILRLIILMILVIPLIFSFLYNLLN